jgi:hypothetical protein
LLSQFESQLVSVKRGISITESVIEGLNSTVRSTGQLGPKTPSLIFHT